MLDYSPESLRSVDKAVLGFHDEKLTMNDMGETVFVFGCYVGEVIVRNRGAKWVMPDEKLQKVGFTMMGVQLKDGTFLNPIGKTIKLLEDGTENSVFFFYTALAAR
ncbi:hypothetical protein ACSFA8_26635 [Variovorax sp. RT4R15]|uniref:hypothetical protein n=1 Tax=Variovorax sp. RT4R15 TaxID=3443737 RepID=UPI003F4512C6